jgi:hypothetical protein
VYSYTHYIQVFFVKNMTIPLSVRGMPIVEQGQSGDGEREKRRKEK